MSPPAAHPPTLEESLLPDRIRSALFAALVLASAVLAATPAPAAAGAQKVAIIVGPVGSLTTHYRTWADEVGSTATAAGATVAKAYSPDATWANVKAAVDGANVIVYFGHGNGYPNPYGANELTDRSNGWGLNTSSDERRRGQLVGRHARLLRGAGTSRHPDCRRRRSSSQLVRRSWRRRHLARARLHDGLCPSPLCARLR